MHRTKDILALPETGEILLFESKDYKVSFSIEIISSSMGPVVCIFDSSAGPDPMAADVQIQTWMNYIHDREMPEVGGASDTKLVMSGTVTLHLRMVESRTWLTFCVADKLIVPVLLETIIVGKCIK